MIGIKNKLKIEISYNYLKLLNEIQPELFLFNFNQNRKPYDELKWKWLI